MNDFCLEQERRSSLPEQRTALIHRAEALADELFSSADPNTIKLPVAALHCLHREGFYTAPLPAHTSCACTSPLLE